MERQVDFDSLRDRETPVDPRGELRAILINNIAVRSASVVVSAAARTASAVTGGALIHVG